MFQRIREPLRAKNKFRAKRGRLLNNRSCLKVIRILEESKHERRKKEQRGGGRIPWPSSEIEQQIMMPRTRAPVRSLSLKFKCQMPISALLAEFSTRDIG